jgi:DegV family protein with EDD domain
MTVRVVTDSGCDIPPSLCAELSIDVVPLTIRFGDEEFVDRVDLTAIEFWERVAASPALPETAAPAPGAFAAAIARAADDGAAGVVIVTLSRKMSATIQAAELGAEGAAIPVRVVDSKNASLGEGMVAVLAARAGATSDDVEAVAAVAASAADRVRLFAALDTLENLRKGGRIGGAQAMLGGLLSIKPIISVEDGEVTEAGKQRTRAKAVGAIVEKASALGPLEALAFMHAEAGDADEILAKVRGVAPALDIVVGDVGAVIGTHVGPRCVGIVAVVAS